LMLWILFSLLMFATLLVLLLIRPWTNRMLATGASVSSAATMGSSKPLRGSS
jgi:hypothetical protein